MKRLRNVFFCAVLALASLGGTPMRAEEIEELMHAMSQPKIAHTLPDENATGDDPMKKFLETGYWPSNGQ